MTNAISNPADRREYSRIDLVDAPRPAWLDCGNQNGLGAEILDVSLGGARLRIDQGMGNLKGLLKLLVDQIEASAEIVWQTATEIGLRFLESAGEAPINILERILKSELSFAKEGANVVEFSGT
jgi:hypothetical protein